MRVIDIQTDQLLEHSLSTHGFWLVNGVEAIRDDLESMLVSHGLNKSKAMLDDYESPFVKSLYKKIEQSREVAV